MYYTRAVASRRIQCVRACLVAMALGTVPLSARQLPAELAGAAGAVDTAARYVTAGERIERAGAPSLALTIISRSSSADRAPVIAASARQALTLLDAWLGPLRRETLTIVDAPWNSRLTGGVAPGVAVVRSRWLTTSRDRALERALIAGIAREYWIESGVAAAFANAASVYTAGRAIDAQLEGSQFHTDRYLGGFLPYSLRALMLSPIPRDARPRLRRYDEASWGGAAALHVARVIETAERDLGWAPLQQALRAVRSRPGATLDDFVALLSTQQGQDASALFAGALPGAPPMDYAVTGIDNRPNGSGFDVRVTVARVGEGAFRRPLTLETAFADGTVIREPWDGSQSAGSVDYVSVSPGVMAAIDPEVVLILDDRRANNTVRLEPLPANPLGFRLAGHWALWLQNLMLAYSSLV